MPAPAVVICHGFKGFFEWGFFPPLAELLAARGFAAVRFNFHGAGMRPGDERVTDPEAFAGARVSRDVEDLLAVLAALGGRIAPGRLDPGRVAIVGHSRGGGTAVLAAAEESWRERLAALVTWAAVSTFERWGADERAAWRERGSIEVANARTGQVLQIGVEVLDELEADTGALDPLRAAGERRAPWLVVHGAADGTVPVAEAERLAAAAAPTARLEVIPDAGHTFGAVHPFAGPTPHLIAAMNATQSWLREHLRG